MGERGPKCSVCVSPSRAQIEDEIISGGAANSNQAIANRHRFSKFCIENHRAHHMHGHNADSEPKAPPPPNLSGLTPSARAEANVKYIEERIRHATLTGVDARGVAALMSQYNSAQRLAAKLSGGFDITEGMIIRSAPWQRLMVVIRDALREEPRALAKVVGAIENAEGLK